MPMRIDDKKLVVKELNEIAKTAQKMASTYKEPGK